MTVETMQDSDLKSSTGVFADSQNPNTKPLLRKFEKAGNSTDIKYSRKNSSFSSPHTKRTIHLGILCRWKHWVNNSHEIKQPDFTNQVNSSFQRRLKHYLKKRW